MTAVHKSVQPDNADITAINRRESDNFPTPPLRGLSPRKTMVEMTLDVRLIPERFQ
jgi:hypothetical protein